MSSWLELLGLRRPAQPVEISRLRLTIAVICGIAGAVAVGFLLNLLL